MHGSGEVMATGLSGRGARAGSVPGVTAELMEVLVQCELVGNSGAAGVSVGARRRRNGASGGCGSRWSKRACPACSWVRETRCGAVSGGGVVGCEGMVRGALVCSGMVTVAVSAGGTASLVVSFHLGCARRLLGTRVHG